MMKKLKVHLKKKEVMTTIYEYEFTDNKGVKVTGILKPTRKEALWAIKDKTKRLDYDIEIIEEI